MTSGDGRRRKRALVDALLAQLEVELGTMRRAAKVAREAATHEEAKPENDKDTRALEASYLAGAQAARVREIEVAMKAIASMELLDLERKPVQASAVVTLEDEDGKATIYFLALHGGGTTLDVDGGPVQVVTPQSPLGRALLGHSDGDAIEVFVGGRRRELTILEVS